MPKSRHRRSRSAKHRHRKLRAHRPADIPFPELSKLFGALTADDFLGSWYDRAAWSFFRGPDPIHYTDPTTAPAAIARAHEWFLLDLVLPGVGKTAAEYWIDQESEAQGWADTTIARYRRYLQGRYGLFLVDQLAERTFQVFDLLTGTKLWTRSAFNTRLPVGSGILGRLFPGDAGSPDRAHPGDDPPFICAPSVALIPNPDLGALKSALRDIRDLPPALELERLLGASSEWMPPLTGSRRLRRHADEFFLAISDGGVDAERLTAELEGLRDPAPVFQQLLSELDPLTYEEPVLATAFLTSLYVERHPDTATRHDLKSLLREVASSVTRSVTGRTVKPPPLPVPRQAPFALSEHEVARLRALPQDVAATWVGDRRQVHLAVQPPGQLPTYPDAICWMEEPSGLIVSAGVVDHGEPDEAIVRSLVTAMTRPPDAELPVAGGGPRRPGRVTVPSRDMAARLKPALDAIGVAVEARYIAPALAAHFVMLESGLSKDLEHAGEEDAADMGSYLSLPGADTERVDRLFHAAADFYRAAPWTCLSDEEPLWLSPRDLEAKASVGRDEQDERPLGAVMLGAGGQTTGLALYLEPDDLNELLDEPDELDVADVEEHDTMVVTFDRLRDIPASLASEYERHEWPIAGRKAYPVAFRTRRGEPFRLLAGVEIDRMATVLSAVTEFVTRHRDELRRSDATVDDEIPLSTGGTVGIAVDRM